MLLPIHPQPQPGELLSSWMVRLSLENGWHLHTFYKVIVGYGNPIWNRDIDKYPHTDLIKCLSEVTEVPVEKVSALSLQSYYGVLFHRNPTAANLKWILPIGIYHRRHRRTGQQFCPFCLQEQHCSFYRKVWRVAFYTTCHRHGCQLLETCPECTSSIEFNRLGIGSKCERLPRTNISLCHQCGFDLRQSPTESINHLSSEAIAPYLYTLARFVSGEEQCVEKGIAIPLSYYEGLRYLVKMIQHPYSREFRSFYLLRFTNLKDLDIRRGTAYEYQPATTRFHIAAMACWLADDWPKNVEYACQNNLLFRTAVSDDIESLPYWVYKIIDKNLPNKVHILSKNELSEAINYIRKHHGVVKVSLLAEVLGVSKDSASRYLSSYRRSNQSSKNDFI